MATRIALNIEGEYPADTSVSTIHTRDCRHCSLRQSDLLIFLSTGGFSLIPRPPTQPANEAKEGLAPQLEWLF